MKALNPLWRFSVCAVGLTVVLAVVWLLHARSSHRADLEFQEPPVPREAVLSATPKPEPAPTLEIWPQQMQLSGPGDSCQVVVTRRLLDDTAEDVTRKCNFQLDSDTVARVSAEGYVEAMTAGAVALKASYGEAETTGQLRVGEATLPVSDFALDIVPLLTKAGCNGGQCHGAADGKAGFHLSLFGYDPAADYRAIVEGHEGRRVNRDDPEASLVLMKPSLTVPHGGKLRLPPDGPGYERVLRWIEAGLPEQDATRGRLERIVVEPADRLLDSAPTEQQLVVMAEYADGTLRDVTRLCLYLSNDPATVKVDRDGLATLLRRGEGVVVVRFANQVATVRLGAPFLEHSDFDYAAVPAHNFIDRHVLRKLKHMRLPVSPRSGDSEFLRRIYFDLVGHMPDPDSRQDANVTEDFLASADPEKRDKLIDRLLEHPDVVYFWALKFGDLLQINSAVMGTAAGSYRIWLRRQLELDRETGENTSYEQLVRTLLLAKGSLKPGELVAPAVYYASPNQPNEIAEQVARRFLGVRIGCARCHDHPLDVWTQDDYYGFASFFGGVRVEVEGGLAQEVGLVRSGGVQNPRTEQIAPPKYLGGGAPEIPDDATDVRELLVEWMLSPANPRFARTAVNWVWAHLMGRGLIEPVDDLRVTNPASNPDLLDELANYFRESGYDLRALIRTICQSETYQRSSCPMPGNEQDEQFYSHALTKPLSAQQMADAVALVTGVPNRYGQTMARGTRAIEINDPNVPSYLLDVLGRCDRTGNCAVGALVRPASLRQALHLIIGTAINEKLPRRESVVSQMAEAVRDLDQTEWARLRAVQIRSIYMRAYCRRPTTEESQFWEQQLAEADHYRAGLEDMLWAILNSREFAFNH